ncbi:MAG: PIN domain-containing protein [Chloroflexota bacterium]
MIAEVISERGIEPRNAVNYLKSHPDMVKELNRYKTIPSDIGKARVRILDLTYQELHAGKQFCANYGLMTGDSTIIAMMRKYKLTDLATNDPDFEKIPQIRVWMPK